MHSHKTLFAFIGIILLIFGAMAIFFISVAINHREIGLSWVLIPLAAIIAAIVLIHLGRDAVKHQPTREEQNIMAIAFLVLGVIATISGAYNYRSEGVFLVGIIFIFIGIIYLPGKQKIEQSPGKNIVMK